MSLLTLTDVRRSFGNLDVLAGATFFLTPRQKVALIGPNGAGKSTLLRLICALDTPDSGRITLQPNARVALLSQEPLVGDARTVLEAAQRPTRDLQDAWHEWVALEASALDDDAALDRYDAAHQRFQDLGGYECETRAKEILGGLGFAEDMWDRSVQVLSGGERTRLALVQILVIQPDLLLMDEPTNHVDWAACEWLQEYLRRYPGAALIVSHDRYFLDQVAEEIVELERGATRTYRGNYTAYSARKAVEREQAEEEYRRRREEIGRQQEIIQRLRSHRNYSAMHSRERELERLQDEAPARPRADAKGMKLRLGGAARSGQETLVVRGLAHGFGERDLFSDLEFVLERGQRLAIVGPNGAGKTTLLRILAGEGTARRGSVEYGFRVRPAYFAQDLSNLDVESTVWETIWDTGALDNQQAVQALHQFLFVGDALNRSVGDLSGGERTRLALCRALVRHPNLLLLDEPTNHLDIASREAVERALRTYPGTVIVVSHDRYFLQAVATRLLEIRGGEHRFFPGTFEEYRRRTAAPEPARKKPAAVAAAAARPARSRAVSPGKQLSRVEAEIQRLEARRTAVEPLLADPALWQDHARGVALTAELAGLTQELEARYEEWASLSEAVRTGQP